MKCKIFGHKFEPFEYYIAEFFPRELKPIYNKDGFQRISKVYCTSCGEIRKVQVKEEKVRYVNDI